MSAPPPIISAFVRQAVSQGGVSALFILQKGVWDNVIKKNGKQLVSATVNGETVNFSFDASLTAGNVIECCEIAQKWMCSHTDKQIQCMLDGNMPSASVGRFCKPIF